MAYVRARETKLRRNGKPVKTYAVVWREPMRDEFGLPTGHLRARRETYPTRNAAEARRDELNNAKHGVGGTSALAEQRAKGTQPFGFYARSWLDAQQVRVADGNVKAATAAKYVRLLEYYVLPEVGSTAAAAITHARCREFRAALVNRRSRVGDGRLSPGTVKHVWAVFRAVLALALSDGAIASNPADGDEFKRKRASGDRAKFEHHPLKPAELGALCAALAGQPANDPGDEPGTASALPAYPVYALMVGFMAATGLRASEAAGLEVGDLVRAPTPAGAPSRMAVRVARTKERKNGVWVIGTLKSKKSRRTVPLPPWLAAKVADYLKRTHPRAKDDTAPLWPGRSATVVAHIGKRRQTAHDWDDPVDMPTFYRRVFRPALLAAGLPASEPATPATKTAPARLATHGVRLHDLRHTFAAQQKVGGIASDASFGVVGDRDLVRDFGFGVSAGAV
jgi:integrase